jgi:transcriptional regulator with XRE-family HTH domain
MTRSKGGQDREALNRELARLPREMTTAITQRMRQKDMNRTELAAAMGVSPGRVSQILSGDENLTLHTLASVCVALDARLEAKLVPNREDARYPVPLIGPAPPLAPAPARDWNDPGSPWSASASFSGLPGR